MMTERFDNIMAKKEEACIQRNDTREKKKAEKFDRFMVGMEKNIKLEENRVELAANSDDSKMFFLAGRRFQDVDLEYEGLRSICGEDHVTLPCKMFKHLPTELEGPTAEE